jgi:hypothetical protein
MNWIYICYVEESRSPLWSWPQNGDVFGFLWGTNWIYTCYVEESGPPLWSSGQSSWLQIQRSGFNSRHYQIFWEVVGLERGSLYLVITIEEPFERNSSRSGLENREYGREDPLRWPCDTLYPQRLALTSPTSGGRSVRIVCWRTKATEFYVWTCNLVSYNNRKGAVMVISLRAGWPRNCSSILGRSEKFFSSSSRPALGPT